LAVVLIFIPSVRAELKVFDVKDNGAELMKRPPPLKYDWSESPRLNWGYNDLDSDGTPETLLTVWMGQVLVFISDDGRLPWPIEDEERNWNDYFTRAFNVWSGMPPIRWIEAPPTPTWELMRMGRGNYAVEWSHDWPPPTWSEMRRGWGNYTLMIDRDGCGRFDTTGDLYYKILDFNGDGAPEAEFAYHFPGERPWGNKLHVNLNGETDFMPMDWARMTYGNEYAFYPGDKYWHNVHGRVFLERRNARSAADLGDPDRLVRF